MRIRITKEFRFEASHFLPGHDGPCAHIHGHSYRLFVTLMGTPLDMPGDPHDGMVMDFGQLKALVTSRVIQELDHRLMVREGIWPDLLPQLEERTRVVRLPFQPTCENLLGWMVAQIQPSLPSGVMLHALKLHETATSFAEWHAQDQPVGFETSPPPGP